MRTLRPSAVVALACLAVLLALAAPGLASAAPEEPVAAADPEGAPDASLPAAAGEGCAALAGIPAWLPAGGCVATVHCCDGTTLQCSGTTCSQGAWWVKCDGILQVCARCP